jgi:hypothetical protein
MVVEFFVDFFHELGVVPHLFLEFSDGLEQSLSRIFFSFLGPQNDPLLLSPLLLVNFLLESLDLGV